MAAWSAAAAVRGLVLVSRAKLTSNPRGAAGKRALNRILHDMTEETTTCAGCEAFLPFEKVMLDSD